MNYRHGYHAGNFGDVLKHWVLVELLEALRRKDTPFCVLDTHAGRGLYDLSGQEAGRTREWEGGVGRLWHDDAPVFAAYRAAVARANPEGALRHYPGSPVIVREALRAHDRLIACELQPEEATELKALFRDDHRVAVHAQDGYAALKAFLPPAEKRGLVLIDPPYERPEEYDDVAAALAGAWRRWPTGLYALWVPVKGRAPVRRLYRTLADAGLRKLLAVELLAYPDDTANRMNGSAMLLVNPPWQFDERLRVALPLLAAALGSRAGSDAARVEWLVPE